MKPGIYRQKLTFEGNFTTIPNKWIRSTGLSVNANFLLVYLLTHEIGYNITFNQIEKEIQLGETAIRTAMNQLKEAGWLETYRTVDDRGYNAGLAWILKDPDAIGGQNPNLANPALDEPALDSRGTLENNLTKKTTYREDISEFEKFWNVYPRKVAKKSALKAWVACVTKENLDDVVAGAIRFAHDPNLPVEQFVPHPSTWLRSERWLDGPLPERQMSPEEREAKELAAIARRRELDRKHAEEILEVDRLARATADAPRCEHGKLVVACMPCIRAGKV